ncbi:transcriptional regulator [Cyanothece sp. BG0011]|uniref:transcriptional regulator n=1 Tax=Cyanothece sp. BG0011 TaxID=2082950 RepID=UPI000D1D8A56|nr:transcriptional regulator [Cyanothece sp. BG0011]
MPVKNYQDDLLKRLSNPHYASQYLKVALDETFKDGNKEAFILALNNIMQAKKMFKSLPETTEKSQEEIDQILGQKEQLTIENLLFILQLVGISIDFKPILD